MTETTTEPTSNWPTLEAPQPVPPAADPAKRTTVLKGVGLLATGLVAGAIGVATIHGSQGSTTANTGRGGFPGGQGGFRGGPPGGFGGQNSGAVSGTVASIGTAGLTVTTPSGSQAVMVSSSTTITLNGAAATLSQLRKGDAVQVTVGADGSASAITATGPART